MSNHLQRKERRKVGGEFLQPGDFVQSVFSLKLQVLPQGGLFQPQTNCGKQFEIKYI